MNQEQIDYVKKELGSGVSSEAIIQALAEAGYEQTQIEQLLQAAQGQVTSQIPATPSVSIKSVGLPLWGKILIGFTALVLVVGVVLFSLMTISLSASRDQVNDASDMTSLSNLRSQAEVHYNTSGFSYVGFCESPRAQTLLSVLVDQDCVAEKENYRVSARLLSGEYYCVDSGGRAERLVTEPLGLSCADSAVEEVQNPLGSQNERQNVENVEPVILGSDSARKQRLNSMRFEAEIHYDDNNFAYSGFCEAPEIGLLMFDADSADCAADGDMYRVSIDLISDGYYCIDGTGFAGEVSEKPRGATCQSMAEDKTAIIEQVFNAGLYADIYFLENSFSFTGFCQSSDAVSLLATPTGQIDCIDSETQYRMSIQLSEGKYACLNEDLDIDLVGNEVVVISIPPTGFSCQ